MYVYNIYIYRTLSNWWTDGDARRFTEKARCIENFYSSFSFFGHHVNGALTLGFFSLVWSV
jgi:predicted metalloendopeptidase